MNENNRAYIQRLLPCACIGGLLQATNAPVDAANIHAMTAHFLEGSCHKEEHSYLCYRSIIVRVVARDDRRAGWERSS